MLDGLVCDQGYLLGEMFYMQVVLCYGDYLVKLLIVFMGEVVELIGQQVKGGYLVMCDVIIDWFSMCGVIYELCVQFCIDLKVMFVEDVVILWDFEILLYCVIVMLYFDLQDSYLLSWQVQGDDYFVFNLWNGVVVYWFLGGIMCICKVVYEFLLVL